MINAQEVRDFAVDFGLDPNVVEKDYALGWLLAGIGQHPVIGQEWLFKGGTCLKKCFFETYRFSEDLDFTVTNSAHINEQFLLEAFGEIAEWIYEQSGIELPRDTHRFEVYENPRGHHSVMGRVGYRGPMGRQGGIPRIKLDLTDDERVVLEAERREVHHPYSDKPADGIQVQVYRFEEVFAEKLRALVERLRPRDLYDVVHLHRRDELGADREQVVETLRQKCEFKGIPVPTIAAIQAHPEVAALQNDWAQMLGHQLPALPPFDEFWNELPEVFAWLLEEKTKAVPAAIQVRAREGLDETWRAPAMGSSWRRDYGVTAPLELIRFSAVNHLCVKLDYRKESGVRTEYLIEPYSLRRTSEGNLVLYGVKHQSGESRSFRVDRILGAAASATRFTPRYAIELTSSGPVSAPGISRPMISRSPSFPALRKSASRPRSRSLPRPVFGRGPSYVYQCPYCDKKFTRKNRNPALKPHRTKDGWSCSGRNGYFVEMKY